MNEKITTTTFIEMKKNKKRITMLTAYDYYTAKIMDDAGIDGILVGDSLGMVMLGYENTLPVTMDIMVHHVKAVTRGVKKALVVGDMPFLSYHVSIKESVRNAGRILQEGGAHAVKLEGGREVADKIKAIIAAGIPVMGHLGLTPQSVNLLGGFKVQGKDYERAKRILEDALILQEAGVFSIVLECVPRPLAKLISEKLDIPTIGIGAGDYCDGQILVTHDMLGLFGNFTPKFVKKYADLGEEMVKAIKEYIKEVEEGKFPEEKHSFKMDEEIIERIKKEVGE